MIDTANDRREKSRRFVRWKAECRLGGSFVEGTICDISRGGVFFRPERGEDSDHHDAGSLSFAERGDTLLLKYLPRVDTEPVTVLATVRWLGKSTEHKAMGAGLAFDELR